jgi:phage anti-repressor protein
MITPMDKAAAEAFEKGIVEVVGVEVGNLNGVTKGTFGPDDLLNDPELSVLFPLASMDALEPQVDLRSMHGYLGSKRDFSNWVNQRTKECDLIENQDFGVRSTNLLSKECGVTSKGRGGNNAKDYWSTLDAAKEIAMQESNALGKKVRRYLISVRATLCGSSA